MVPCEICEVFKKTYFEENLPMTAPEEAFKKPWTYEGSRESYWSVLEFFWMSYVRLTWALTLEVFWCFQEVEKSHTGNKWLNNLLHAVCIWWCLWSNLGMLQSSFLFLPRLFFLIYICLFSVSKLVASVRFFPIR